MSNGNPHLYATMLRRVQILVWCAGMLAMFSRAETANALQEWPALKKAADVRALSPEEASGSHPVRLKGIVTFYDSITGALFVQDATAGIFVSGGADDALTVQPGNEVEVNGVTGPGDYAPVVLEAQLQICGKRPLPDPIHTAVDHLKTGREDSQRVEIEAFVRSSRIEDGSTTLKFASGGEHFTGNIPHLTNTAAGEELIDTKVRVTGICGTVFDEKRQLKGIKLYIPDISQLRVEEASPTNPFSLPVKPIASIVQFNPYRIPGHRVRVQGIVTLRRTSDLFLRDGTHGLFVRAGQLPDVAPGDHVDVAGFPEFNPFTPQLDDATVRIIRSGQPPLPMRVAASRLRDGTFDSELVQIEARVLNRRSSKTNELIILESEGDIFKANLEIREPSERISDLRVGCRVMLTGICSIQENSVREPVGFRLLLRSPADIIVLAKPSWWTPSRIQEALALIAVLALAGLSWLIMLHVRVRLQNRIIGERLERETALEQRYRDIFENASDVIYTHDLKGNLTSLNTVGERLLGYSPEEALGLSVRQLVAPGHLTEAEQITARKLAGEELPAHALEVITKQKQCVTLEVNSRPILKDGVVVGIQGIARDITERRRAEHALRDSEERYRGLFDLNPLPMWIYDVETFAFLAVNCAAVEHYGYSTEEFLKMKLADIRPDGQMPKIAGGGSQADTGFGGAAIWKHRKKDGTFIYVEVVSSPTDFAGRNARLILINDVTERQRLEDHVRQLQKMESVGQLAAGVAHDFNNLLTVIRGHADMMTLQGVHDPSIREPLREISIATDRAANLTRQLLMFSRKQVMQPRSVNLAEIVRNLARLLRRTLGEHIELHLTGVPDLPPILADTGMMEQVITNLAVNARDAMPRGGHLVIATTPVTLHDQDVGQNREARAGRFVCLTVTDTGCGMDTTTISRIFEPFFTTKEVGKGTGLGLATVYGIVKQHQGWIEVSSRPGNGSAFKVYLPVCRQVAPSTAQEQPSAAFPKGSETILLVEDEAPLRELSCQVLERLGYTVLSAASGVKALSLWQDHKREIDLVVTDMVMPEGVSGRDLGERVKADRPDMKILFVSGYNVELVGDNFVLREGLNFLPKPYNPQALLQAVRKCLDSGPKRDPAARELEAEKTGGS